MKAATLKTSLFFKITLLGLYYKTYNSLTVDVGVSNTRRLSGAGRRLVAGYGISRGNVNFDTLCKAVIDRVCTGVAASAGHEDHITIIGGKGAGC